MTTSWQDSNLYERIMIRQGEMVDERRPYEDDFGDIIEVFNPGLTEFDDQANSDKSKIRDTFDGTPSSALRVMADGMQGSIISRSLPWLRYNLPGPRGVFKGNDQVIQWLQDCEDHMFPVYGKSGLYPALGPYFRAGLSVGTPAIIMEENILTARIECTVPHPRENFFRFDSFGVPVQYHRAFEKRITALLIELKERGIDESVMSKVTQTAIKTGAHNTKVQVIQVYYRSDDPIFEGLKVSGVNGDILPDRPWRTYLLEKNADPQADGKKVPFEAAGYFERPHAVWRFEVSSDEIYARTPAWFALHDARGEIQASKTLAEAAEGYVRPAYLATEGMRGRIRRRPSSITYKPTDQDTVTEMPQGGKNYPIANEERDRMVANVERWFDVAFYLMLQRQMLSGGSPPTATQIIGAGGEQALLRGTRIGRVSDDVLTPIDDRFWSLELNANRLPQPPDEVLDPKFGIEKVDAEFIGPLLQAQKKAAAFRRFLEGKGVIDSFSETWPNLIHKIKSENLLEKTLEAIGFDMSSIRSEEEYAEIIEQIAEREMQQQAMEAGAAAADAAPKLGKAVEPNSPLAAAVR